MPYDVNKRLSEDVLRLIMWDYVFTEELQSLGQISIIWNPKPLPFDAVVISSICKKWRRVALDHPTLWSQIHFRWPRTTILMYMARRRQMPLSIAIDERAWNSDEFPEFGLTLSDTLQTVERISIEWCHGWYTDKRAPADLTSWVFSLLTKKMPKPKLRELELRFNGSVRSDLSLDFPELSNINVRNISLKAFRPSWHRLTDVIVNSSDLTLSEILGFLGAAQMLEDIVLYHRDRGYIPDEDDDAEVAASKSNDPPTSLPNLKHFKIHWCSDQFADQILRRIRFPSSSSVVLSIARREDDSIFESLPRFVADNLRSAHTLRIDVHTDEYVPFPAFLLFFQTADSPSYRLQFNEGDHLLLTPNDRAEVIYPQGNALLADLTSISFDKLLDATINSRFIPTTAVMHSLFKAFRNVEKLTVRAYVADSAITALRAVKDSSIEHRPCPKLRTLDIQGSQFDHIRLNKMLTNRKQWANDLEELKLTLDRKKEGRMEPEDRKSRKTTLRKVSRIVTTYEVEDGNVTGSSDNDSDPDIWSGIL